MQLKYWITVKGCPCLTQGPGGWAVMFKFSRRPEVSTGVKPALTRFLAVEKSDQGVTAIGIDADDNVTSQ